MQLLLNALIKTKPFQTDIRKMFLNAKGSVEALQYQVGTSRMDFYTNVKILKLFSTQSDH